MLTLIFVIFNNLRIVKADDEKDGKYYLFPTSPYIIELNNPNQEVKLTRDATGNVEIAHRDPYDGHWTGPVQLEGGNTNDFNYSQSQPFGDRSNIETFGKWVFSENMKPAYAPSPAEIMNSPVQAPMAQQNYSSPNAQYQPKNSGANLYWGAPNPTNFQPAQIGTYQPMRDASNQQAYSGYVGPKDMYNGGMMGKEPCGKRDLAVVGTGTTGTEMGSLGDCKDGKDMAKGGKGGKGADGDSTTAAGSKKGKKKSGDKSKSKSKDDKSRTSSASKAKKKSSAVGIGSLGLTSSVICVMLGCCLFQA